MAKEREGETSEVEAEEILEQILSPLLQKSYGDVGKPAHRFPVEVWTLSEADEVCAAGAAKVMEVLLADMEKTCLENQAIEEIETGAMRTVSLDLDAKGVTGLCRHQLGVAGDDPSVVEQIASTECLETNEEQPNFLELRQKALIALEERRAQARVKAGRPEASP